LLDRKAGLTIITGGTDFSRTFVFTALAHAASRADGKLPAAAGIDLHRSNLFVPVESLIYINGDLGLDHARRLTQRIWPRVLTSGAPRLFFNRVWSSMPEVRDDLLRCAGFKHVVIAEEGASNVGDLTTRVSFPIRSGGDPGELPARAARQTPGKLRFWKRRPFNGLDISGIGVKNEAP
jgi:hypothetical protein